jgi:hypothetical protein
MNYQELLELFTKSYAWLYENNDNFPLYKEYLEVGDEFIEKFGDFVGEFAKYRGDYISSDREVVALVMALTIGLMI